MVTQENTNPKLNPPKLNQYALLLTERDTLVRIDGYTLRLRSLLPAPDGKPGTYALFVMCGESSAYPAPKGEPKVKCVIEVLSEEAP